MLVTQEISSLDCAALKENHCNKEEALKRENVVLGDQLKEYVSLVQAQQKETITKQTSADGNVCVSVCLSVCLSVVYKCVIGCMYIWFVYM